MRCDIDPGSIAPQEPPAVAHPDLRQLSQAQFEDHVCDLLTTAGHPPTSKNGTVASLVVVWAISQVEAALGGGRLVKLGEIDKNDLATPSAHSNMSDRSRLSPTPHRVVRSAYDASTLETRHGALLGTGLDLVAIGRLHHLVAMGGDAFLERAWTKTERDEANGDTARLATRWAAKEAAMKCLGLGLADIDPLDVEVTNDRRTGAPQIALTGAAQRAADHLGITRIHVSASHEDGWAAALAIATRGRTSGASPTDA